MAFNPFTTFQKYRKYWMAGSVLLCDERCMTKLSGWLVAS